MGKFWNRKKNKKGPDVVVADPEENGESARPESGSDSGDAADAAEASSPPPPEAAKAAPAAPSAEEGQPAAPRKPDLGGEKGKPEAAVRRTPDGRIRVDESTAAERVGGQRDVKPYDASELGVRRRDESKPGTGTVSPEKSLQVLSREVAEARAASDEDVLASLARSMGMEQIDLRSVAVPPEVLEEVNAKIANDYRVFPIESTEDTITLAVADPLDIRITDELPQVFNKRVIAKLASEREIDRAIRRHYDKESVFNVIKQTVNEELDRQAREADEEDEEDEAQSGVIDLDKTSEEDTPVVRFVDLLFRQAVHDRASDIHVEPTKYSVTIRFRIDGVLHEMPSPPKKWQNQIVSRLKVMSGMDLAEKRVPQDGRIQLNVLGKALDLRVSCLPSLFGESMVMRILDQTNVLLGLEDVGFLEDNIRKFDELIRSPNGVILMTGPTGSGKTTTLYAALGVLNGPETKIVTIEDPVEYQIQGINQMQVNREVELDFARGLRTVLRQSPDVIMVGEIRDHETAEAAIQAALTGHLVFSTLHTNDAPSASIRLIDIGIKPFLVASAVQAVIAQRLIRRMCSHCKSPYTPTPEEFAAIGVDPKDYLDHEFVIGRGCDRCNRSGYRGRTAIHEIFEMNPELRQMIIRRESNSRLKAAAVRGGMRSLRMDGWEKVLRGNTSIEEVLRITSMD